MLKFLIAILLGGASAGALLFAGSLRADTRSSWDPATADPKSIEAPLETEGQRSWDRRFRVFQAQAQQATTTALQDCPEPGKVDRPEHIVSIPLAGLQEFQDAIASATPYKGEICKARFANHVGNIAVWRMSLESTDLSQAQAQSQRVQADIQEALQAAGFRYQVSQICKFNGWCDAAINQRILDAGGKL